jgi:hypothetical protein
VAAARRVQVWPAAALGVVCTLLGIWAFISVQHRMGLTPNAVPQVKRSGSAEVRSCSVDPVYMWLTWTCDAEVRWPGQPAPVTERVRSVHALTGTVDVNERSVPSTRYRTTREVASADYPGLSDGVLFFVMMMGFVGVSMAIGFFAGSRLARLLPEPPEKPEKLTLRSKRKRRRSKR